MLCCSDQSVKIASFRSHSSVHLSFSPGNIRFGSADDVSVATSAGSADYLDTQAVPSNQLSLISTVTTLKSQMSSLRQDCANFSDFRVSASIDSV